MSTGTPKDPVCSNDSTSPTAVPPKAGSSCFVADPVCRVITPPTADQTATPGAPP